MLKILLWPFQKLTNWWWRGAREESQRLANMTEQERDDWWNRQY